MSVTGTCDSFPSPIGRQYQYNFCCCSSNISICLPVFNISHALYVFRYRLDDHFNSHRNATLVLLNFFQTIFWTHRTIIDFLHYIMKQSQHTAQICCAIINQIMQKTDTSGHKPGSLPSRAYNKDLTNYKTGVDVLGHMTGSQHI